MTIRRLNKSIYPLFGEAHTAVEKDLENKTNTVPRF